MNSFGLHTVNGTSEFDELIRTLDAVRPTTAEMLSRRGYHRDYGICVHDPEKLDPLDLVRLHPKEDIWEGGPERTWIRKYVNYKIKDTYGLDLETFLGLPYYSACFLVEMAEAALSKRGPVDAAVKQIEKELSLK